MDVGQDSHFLEQQNSESQKYSGFYRDNSTETSIGRSVESKETYCPPYEFKTLGREFYESPNLESSRTTCLYSRVRVDESERLKGEPISNQELSSNIWNTGWDACASEALRYLVEDEGLPPHHPTVVTMKNHLDVQREQAFLR